MAIIKQWTEPTDFVSGEGFDPSLFNRRLHGNMLYLNDRPHDFIRGKSIDTGSTNITNTTWQKDPNSSYKLSIDTRSGNVMVFGSLYTTIPALNYFSVGILVDDSWLAGENLGRVDSLPAVGGTYYHRDVPILYTFIFSVPLFGLGSGLHTFEPVFSVSGGTGSFNRSEDNNLLAVVEI